jgi:hypothetical protein
MTLRRLCVVHEIEAGDVTCITPGGEHCRHFRAAGAEQPIDFCNLLDTVLDMDGERPMRAKRCLAAEGERLETNGIRPLPTTFDEVIAKWRGLVDMYAPHAVAGQTKVETERVWLYDHLRRRAEEWRQHGAHEKWLADRCDHDAALIETPPTTA